MNIIVSFAGHRAGGQYSWECLNDSTYVVRWVGYIDCDHNVDGTTKYCLTGSSGGDPNNGSYSVDFSNSIPHPIEDPCVPCVYPWLTEVYYYDTIILQSPISSYYLVEFCDGGNRPNSASSNSGGYYNNTMIYTGVCNSSAYPTAFPDVIFEVFDTAVLLNNYFDPDGDSLVFSLENCYEDLTTSISYTPPWSGANPLSSSIGWHIDSVGNIIFVPNFIMNGPICLLVREYRNDTLIHVAVNEFFVSTIAPLPPPLITEKDSNTSVVAGQDTCVRIEFSNSFSSGYEIIATVNMDSTLLANGANWISLPVSDVNNHGFFCWTAPCDFTGKGPYFVEIYLVDNACPFSNRDTMIYEVVIDPPLFPKADFNFFSDTCSNGFTTTISNQSKKDLAWEWTVSNITQGTVAYYNTENLTHSFQPGLNSIELVVFNNCLSDTITNSFRVNRLPFVDAGSDTTICHYDTITLNGSTDGVSFFWFPTTGLNNVSTLNPLFYPSASSKYFLNSIAANGCTNQDSIEITVIPKAMINAGRDSIICENTSIVLGGNPTADPGKFYSWYPSSSLNFANVSNPIASPPIDSGFINYYLTVSDIYGCFYLDTIQVDIEPVNEVDAGVGGFICQGQSLQLQANGAQTYNWVGANLSNPTADDPNSSPSITTTYTVFGTDLNGCTSRDEVVVYVFGDNSVEIVALDTSLCPGDTFRLDATIRQNFCNDYEVNAVPFAPIPITGDTVFIEKDDYSNYLPIGFSFEFFCEPYTELRLSSNGFLKFGSGDNEKAPQILPDPNDANNILAFAWDEWDPNFGAYGEVIRYTTVGTAPNRIFIMDIDSMRHRNDANSYFTGQIQLYETSHLIEFHTTAQTYAGNDLTMGIENSNGSTGFNVVGRNKTSWTVVPGSNDAWQFKPVTSPNTTYIWTPSANLDDSTSPTPKGTYNGPISYTVQVTSGSCTGQEDVIFLEDASLEVTTVPVEIAICDSGSVPLNAFVSYDTVKPKYICEEYLLESIPFDPLDGGGEVVDLKDDDTKKIKIGFNFRFYCEKYKEVRLSSNGFLIFDDDEDGCCSGQALPDPAKPNNLIAFAWEDLDPEDAGEINYYTTGAFPNRIFVANYIDIPHSPGPGNNNNVTAQVQLHEVDNSIEIHLLAQPDSLGVHTLGIENEFGDDGVAVPAFNGTNWSTSNQGYRFSLKQLLGNPPTIQYTWYPSLGLSDTTISDPIATVRKYTEYIVEVHNGACVAIDTAKVFVKPDTSLKVLTQDVIACPNSNIPLSGNAFYDIVTPDIKCDKYEINSIPFQWTYGPSNPIQLEDEDTEEADIGFDFEFFCKSFDKVNISSNGFLSFDKNEDGCCSGQLLPNSTDPKGLIAFAWNNLDPGDGLYGLVEHYTVGAVPNRIFVVNFVDVPHFPGPGPNNNVTVQVKLFESTNIIEVHTVSQPDGNGIHTMGIENDKEDKAFWVPGRNASSWTAANEAWRFEPKNLTPTVVDIFYKWSPSFLVSDSSILNPIANIGDSTTYAVFTAIYNGCISSDTAHIMVVQDTLVNIQLDGDTACPGAELDIIPLVKIDEIVPVKNCAEYNVSGIPYQPVPGNGVEVTLDNDDAQDGLEIGFDFDFFCNIYDEFSISSNGFIQFVEKEEGCCDGQVLPDPDKPNNLIAFAWENLNPDPTDGGSGKVEYFMTGSAPYRKLIVNFIDVPHFNNAASSTDSITSQVILYETTNVIEIHTTTQPDITGFHTMGIENENGTEGVAIPGRNSSNWTATPEAWRFDPVYFTAPGEGPYYSWSPSIGLDDTSALNVTSITDTTIDYIFMVEYDFCKYYDSVRVSRMSDPDLRILSKDLYGCPGEPVSLSGNIENVIDTTKCKNCNEYNTQEIIFSPISGSGTTVALADDQVSPILDIGFDFQFFCSVYKEIRISSNGFLAFENDDWTEDGAGDGEFIPDNGKPNNLIAFAWEDLDPSLFGTVHYFVTGSAPNRIFVVDFDSIPHAATGRDYVSAQIHLYETSNIIEIHIEEQPDGEAIHTLGIEDLFGRFAYSPDGKNSINWEARQEAFRFVPDFSPPKASVYSWSPISGLNDPTISSPIAVLDTSINYVLDIEYGECIVTDTISVIRQEDSNLVIHASPDTIICTPGNILTESDYSYDSVHCDSFGYAVERISFDTINSFGTSVALGDDELSPNINIGFDFNFFCNSYNRIKISSNGFLHFGGGSDDGCCIPQFIPDPGGPNNNIYFAWNNLDKAQIDYFTMGTAPNRKFVVNFNEAEQVGKPSPENNINSQVILYETSGLIEIHITKIPANDVRYTIGIENRDGSKAYTAPGRNSANGKLYYESYRFVPLFNLYPPVSPPVISWTPVSGVSDPSIVNPVATVDSTTDFIVSISYNGCITYDTATVIVNDFIVLTDSTTNVSCNGLSDGTATVVIENGGFGNITYAWSDGQSTQTAVSLSAGMYTVTVSDSLGCFAEDTFIITEPPPLIVNKDSSDVTCNGVNDGSIYISVTGGTRPYSWSHNPLLKDSFTVISNLFAGVYPLSISDSNSCFINMNIQVNEPLPLIISTDSVDVTCFGYNDGSASVYASGGTPPYTYLWSDSQASSTAAGLFAGSYFVTVTDINGCSVSPSAGDSILINEPPSFIITGFDSVDASCFGLNDGKAWVTVSGGISPYTYIWSDGQTADTAFNLAAGFYGVVITDDNGCSITNDSSDSIGINEPAILAVSIDTSHIECNGMSNGMSYVSVSGGSPPYSYLWSDGQTSDTAINLTAGSYTVTISDANGCFFIASTSISEPLALSGSIIGTGPVCNGGNNGEATMLPLGGTAPYSYLWSDGQVNDTAINLAAGQYFVTVADTNGCLYIDSITLTQPALPLTFISDTVDASCFGASDGSATVTASGGVAPYTFLWSDGQNTSTAIGLSAGNYFVTVTDALGCQVSPLAGDSIEIIQPGELVIGSWDSLDASCFGFNDGKAWVSVIGGTGPYSYLWSDGQTSDTAFNLFTGSYGIVITDANGCVTSNSNVDSIFIDHPAALLLNLDTFDINCSGGTDGIAVAHPLGGVPPYSFNWSDGQTTDTAINLSAGSYSVTVIDNNGCFYVGSLPINEPLPLGGTILGSNPVCNGGNEGIAWFIPAGGTSPYTFNWSDGQTADTAVSLTAGWYYSTITDNSGCSYVDSIQLGEPAVPLTFISDTVSASCYGYSDGSATVTASGGTPPYSYLWSDGQLTSIAINLFSGNYFVTVTDAVGCAVSPPAGDSIIILEPSLFLIDDLDSANVSCFGDNDGSAWVEVIGGISPYSFLWSDGQTTDTAFNIAAGTYGIIVTDANGCITPNSSTDSITVNQPAPLSINFNYSDVSCNGLSDAHAVAQVSGGTLPYSYSWGHGPATDSVSGLSAGSYYITVTDNNTCIVVDSVLILQPASITANPGFDSVYCFGDSSGSAYVSPAGGTSPFSFLWSNFAVTDTISNLSTGKFSITVTDSNGCSAIDSIYVEQPGPLSLSTNSTAVSNFGLSNGTATAIPSGGSPPYSYLWSDSQTTQTAVSLAADTYYVSVYDNNGCLISDSVVVSQPDELTASIFVGSHVLCNGDSTGFLTIAVYGGLSPYSFMWSNGSSDSSLNYLTAGTYYVTVTDSTGAFYTDSVNISQPDTMIISASTTNNSCFNSNDGAIDISISGGTPAYIYNWSTGDTSKGISGLPAGNYSISVTDFNGCRDSVDLMISRPLPLSINSTITDVACQGAANGTIDINASGGTAPYNYLWSNTSNSEDLVLVSQGIYSVIVTDNNSCTSSGLFSLSASSVLSISPVLVYPLCGSADGEIRLSVDGGSGSYSFNWSSGNSGDTIIGLSSGEYRVTVSDNFFGCTTVETYILSASGGPEILDSASHVSNCGGTDGSIVLGVNGGSGSYSYMWSDGATTSSRNSLSAGTYMVTVTDLIENCSSVKSIEILDGTDFSLHASSNSPHCGTGDGNIDINVSGGSGLYSYYWNDGTVSEDRVNLYSGAYFMTITDLNYGCQMDTILLLSDSGSLSVNASITEVSCASANDGWINVTVGGGSGNYTWNWTNANASLINNNLLPGMYGIEVWDTITGCYASKVMKIETPDPLYIELTERENILCNGDSTGSLKINITGGTQPYNILWPDASSLLTYDSIPASVNSLTVTDANGCIRSSSFTISEPAPLTFNMNATPVDCYGNSTGSVSVTAIGGVPPYSVLWSDSSTSQIVSNVSAGIYTVTLTDQNGCSISSQSENDSLTVSQPSQMLVTADSQNVSCYGNSDGWASVLVSGGITPYTIVWSDGQSGDSAASLPAGIYIATITDSNNCTYSGTPSATTFDITEPLPIQLAFDTVHLACNGDTTGSAKVTAQSGAAPYTFLWSNGIADSVITNLTAGNYQVTVTDANGCTAGGIADGNIEIIEPAAISISLNRTNVSCYRGSDGIASVFASGGTSPYSYLWSDGQTTASATGLIPGTYSVTVTDQNICTYSDTTFGSVIISEPSPININIFQSTDPSCQGYSDGSVTLISFGGTPAYSYVWSNGQTGSIVSGISSGSYSVTVTDNNGCITTSDSVGLNIQLSDPSSMISTASSEPAICYGSSTGSAVVNVTGGTPMYQYIWDDGQTADSAFNLLTGTHTVTVTDNNSCIITDTVIIGSPPQLIAGYIKQDVSCNTYSDGSLTVNPLGGTPPYYYLWSSGDTSQSVGGLSAGGYFVVVSDSNGCQLLKNMTVEEPDPLWANSSISNALCHGENSGTINTVAIGGTAPYQFAWSSGDSLNFIQSLLEGTYYLTITDSNFCIAYDSFYVSEPDELTVDLVASSPTCFGAANGYVEAEISGGTAPYSLSWSNGENAQVIEDLESGTYTVNVTDQSGCSVIDTAELFQADEIVVLIDDQEYIDLGESIHLEVGHNLNEEDVIYEWSPPTGLSCADCPNPIASPYASQLYTVTVINAADPDLLCSQSAAVFVEVDDSKSIYIPNAFTPNGDGMNDVFNLFGSNVINTRIRIFNKLGEKVFESFTGEGWDGTYKGVLQPNGVYVFHSIITLTNGKTYKETGSLTLIR